MVIESERFYKGKVADGNVKSRKYIFTSSNNIDVIEFCEEKYPNEVVSNKKEVNLTEKESIYLISILPIFENKHKYSEDIDRNRTIPERLEYVDVYINGNHSEIKKDDTLLQELKDMLKINKLYILIKDGF